MRHEEIKINAGDKFLELTVIEYAGKKDNRHFYKCRCSCGVIKLISKGELGRTNSCGAEFHIKRIVTHGLRHHYIYGIWNRIRQCCFNSKHNQYNDYGGRGIVACKFIKESPKNLLKLMGERPSKAYDLDRKDNDGNYSCGQCEECKSKNWPLNIRWIPYTENINNKRPTRISINGLEKSCYEWAMEYKKKMEKQPVDIDNEFNLVCYE